ncbi:MAG: 50S ribosomal protein L29 [Gammaproteobacteria bacterium]|jgi:large subunit ribosomal protein L29
MDTAELRGRSVDELRMELRNLLREKFNLNMQRGTGQLSRPDQMGKVRKDIARVYTVLNEKIRAGDAV